jgi:hypothetical protein
MTLTSTLLFDRPSAASSWLTGEGLMRIQTSLALHIVIGLASAAAQGSPVVEHVIVYHEPGMFGGWPANYGMWIWGDEILVGFAKGYYKDLGDRHHIDRERPEYHMLARSLDGGRTWTVTDPQAAGYLRYKDGGFLHGVPRSDVPLAKLNDPAGGIDFSHPDFALTVRTSSGTSYFSYSYDRGRTWEGPFRLPNFGAPGTAARTDYIVNGPRDCMLFITAARENGRGGQPICVRTEDGGKSWRLVSRIEPEPEGSSIMPASVRISENEILVVVRRTDGPKRWQAAYLSTDDGRTWEHLNDPVPDAGIGNPPALVRLRDGRICLVYGYRGEPYSIRAKLSHDNGRTWSDDITLRDDGGDRDIGYPRVVQRPDGKVVAVYYFNDPKIGPERYIGATIWDPGPFSGQRSEDGGQ